MVRTITKKQLTYDIKCLKDTIAIKDKKGLSYKWEKDVLKSWEKYLAENFNPKVVNESGAVTIET